MCAALLMRTSRATDGPRRSDADGEQMLHRFERAGQFFPIPGKTEPEIALAVRTEVDAGNAADSPVLDEVLGQPPRQRRRRRALAVGPAGIDSEKRVKRARRRGSGEHVAGVFLDGGIKQIASSPQFGPELLDAVLRSLESADAA